MTSSKDSSTSRPVSGSFSKSAHHGSSRPHSHSISLSAANASHRVSRRKSVNASASVTTAHAAIAAALRDPADRSAISVSSSHRRSVGSQRSDAHSMSARPSMHSHFASSALFDKTKVEEEEDAVEDNSGEDERAQKNSKSRNRRASEGSHLIKGEGKKSAVDLRCDTCGKGYKHSSCLTKHMWEHDPAWAITSKLLISKHQQVQLLEAASVLCNMTTETASAAASVVSGGQVERETPQPEASDSSSASPDYSAYSEMQDEPSSVETTPPPLSEEAMYSIHEGGVKRYSSCSTTGFGLARSSYRSVRSTSFAESVLSPGLPPHRLSGVSDFRPTTSGTDDGMLAAAAAGLNFAGTRTMSTPADIPPVPPLPTQYQSHNSKVSESTLAHIYSPFSLPSHTINQQLSDERSHREASDERQDLHIEEDHKEDEDEDEGMFKMEE